MQIVREDAVTPDALDRLRLRKLALAATPGPWHMDDSGNIRYQQVLRGPKDYYIARINRSENWRGNAAYIAACSPDVILSLLDALDAREADSARLDWYEAQHTLHRSLELLYVVDGYELSLMSDDGETELTRVRGDTLRDAIDAALRGGKP